MSVALLATIAEARLRDDAARFRLHLAAERVRAALKFNPNWASQPRVPAGNSDGGQWSNEHARSNPGTSSSPRLANAGDFGTLVAQLGRGRNKLCVYKFSSFSVVVDGPLVGDVCWPSLHWSATTHGRLLNDN